MFEKEAEEYRAKRKDCQYFSESYKNRIEKAFKDGAEFAYSKANEWHYVKDGLPETSDRYLVYTGGESIILDFDTEVNSFGYWVVLLGDDWGVRDEDFETVKDRGEDEVIAWCELPKWEIKEK
jgi:hypothetical protein